MGGIVSCGEAATTTLCTLWNPFSQPFDKACSRQAVLHSRTLCIIPILLYNGLRI